MKVSLNIIVKHLEKYAPSIACEADKNKSFERVRFLAPSVRIDSDTIYVVNYRDLVQRLPNYEQDMYFITNDSSASAAENLAPNLHILSLDAETDMLDVGNELYELWTRLIRWEEDLNQVIFKNAGLQAMLDVSEDLFRNPIVFVTSSLQMPACTKNIPIPHPDIQYAQQHHIFPQSMITDLIKNDYLSESERYETLTYSYAKRHVGCPMLVRSMPQNVFQIKTIGIYNMNTPPCDEEYDLMKYLSDRACEYLLSGTENISAAGSEDRSTEMLRALINDEDRSLDIHLFETLLGLNIDGKYNMYVLRFDHYQESHATFILNILQDTFPSLKTFTNKESLVLLRDPDCTVNAAFIRNFLTSLASDNHAYWIKFSFSKLENLRPAFLVAGDIMELGHTLTPNKKALFAEDYIMKYIVSNVKKSVPLEILYWHKLDDLADYDRAHKTDMIPFLKEYLKQNGSVNDTAAAMHMHRNSVRYRLNKIEEMLDISLEDSKVRFRLWTSLEIFEMI